MSDTASREEMNNAAAEKIREENELFFKDNQNGHIFVKVPLGQIQELNHLKSLKALRRADYNENLQMWEIDEAELVLHPQLTDLSKLSYAEGMNLLKTQLELKDLQKDNALLQNEQRVYLDYLPAEYSQWAAENRICFDKQLGKAYLDGKYAFKEENLPFIAQCRHNSSLNANQIESNEITEGKKLLAEAMNNENYVQRAELLVKAINLCAKESAMQVPGAIKNFDNVVRNFNRRGKSLNYKDSFKLALSYHKAVEIMKRNHLIDDNSLDETEKLAYLQSFMTINRQAGEDLKRSFKGRLSLLLSDTKHSEREKLSLASEIFSDYYHGHVMSFGTQLYDGQLFRKSIGFEEQIFADQLEAIMDKANLQGMEKISMPKNLRTMSKLLGIESIRFENEVREFFAYNDKRNMTAEVFKAKASEIYKQGLAAEETLKEQYKLRGFKPLEAKVLKDLQDSVKTLPSTFEPLYVVLSHDQKMSLDLLHKTKLMADPFSGALCVQDNEENRSFFGRYFPSEAEFARIKKEFDEKVRKCHKILKQSNIIVPESENLFDGQTHLLQNQKLEMVSVAVSFREKPQILINNLTSGETVSLDLKLSAQEAAELNRICTEKIEARLALKSQKEQTIAQNVRKSLGKMVKVSDFEQSKDDSEFNWLKKLNVDPQDLNAFVDEKHIYGDQVFKAQGTASESTLFMPLYNADGRIMSTVAIDDFGHQEFMPGGQRKGNFAVVGDEFKSLTEAEEILICTSLESSVVLSSEIKSNSNEHTAVVCSFGNENLPFVTERIARKMKGGLGICADYEKTEGLGNQRNENFEAAQCAIRAVEDLKPFTEIYLPPLTTVQLSQGKRSWADLAKDKDSLERMKVGLSGWYSNSRT